MSRASPLLDVIVAGAGSAGLAAGVSAARAGARTLLIERHGSAGGMGTASLVHSFCGLYLLRKEPGAVLANPGICTEIERRMIAATGIGPRRYGRVDVLPQHPVEFACMADDLIAAEENLDVSFHTTITGIREISDGWEIDVVGRGGIGQLRASVLVDASGDAITAGMLGAETSIAPGGNLQRPAYVFGVFRSGSASEEENLATAGWIVRGISSGALPQAAMGLAFRPSGREGEWFGTLDLDGGFFSGATGAIGYDPLNGGVISALEAEGRRIAATVVRWLAGNAPGWRGAYINQWPARAGIRESRRWIGENVLTGADVLASVLPEQTVALATWPLEFRENTRGPKLKFPVDERPAGIPRGCLRPLGRKRIWVAGRCISTDHAAQASIRVMGTCFAMGEAAGKLAATEALA